MSTEKKQGLAHAIESCLKDYFYYLQDGKGIGGDLYDTVIGEVERPLLTKTLEFSKGNQKKAADVLGINRNTLRKKIQEFNLNPDDYK